MRWADHLYSLPGSRVLLRQGELACRSITRDGDFAAHPARPCAKRGARAPIPGHTSSTVEVDDGRTLRRFATDKGRAEILRRLDEGLDDVTQDEFDDLTVLPDMDALLERMGREAGEGA